MGTITESRRDMVKQLVYILIFILLLSLCLAAEDNPDIIDAGIKKQNSNIDIKVSCNNAGQLCSDAASCNITVSYPNTTYMIFDQVMSQNKSFYNYTLPDSSTVGVYNMIISCIDVSFSIVKEYEFSITETGDNISNLFIYIVELFMKIGFFIFLIVLSIWGIQKLKKAEKTPYRLIALLRTVWASASYVALFISPILALFLFHPNFSIGILRVITLDVYFVIFIIAFPIFLFNLFYFGSNMLLKLGGFYHDVERTNKVLNDLSKFSVDIETFKNKTLNKVFKRKE